MAEQMNHIFVRNVRCSFIHLFVKPIFDGEESPYGANILFDTQDQQHMSYVRSIQADMAREGQRKWPGNKVRLTADKICLKKGEDTARPEYDGFYVLSANTARRPCVLASDGRTQVMHQEDCLIYSGCRVNVKFGMWAQDNQWGKRLNAQLIAIQFASHDEPLDSSYVPLEQAVEGFGAVEEDFDDGFDSPSPTPTRAPAAAPRQRPPSGRQDPPADSYDDLSPDMFG